MPAIRPRAALALIPFLIGVGFAVHAVFPSTAQGGEWNGEDARTGLAWGGLEEDRDLLGGAEWGGGLIPEAYRYRGEGWDRGERGDATDPEPLGELAEVRSWGAPSLPEPGTFASTAGWRQQAAAARFSLRGLAAPLWLAGAAQEPGEDAGEGGSSPSGERTLADLDPKEASQQSANPVGEFAYIFTQFANVFSDGDARGGNDTKHSGQIVFQPIIPIPVYGAEENEWRIVTRPTIGLNISQPVPQTNETNRKTGLTDTLIPLPLALPDKIAGRWLLALGPDFALPTATHNAFGTQQWAAGVTGVFGYIGENWMAGAYPQFYWRIADAGRNNDVKKARFGNMFYWFWYNLSPTLQVGWSPTIQFNDQAKNDDKWNVPVGLYVAKLAKVGPSIIRFEVGCDYSVVHEDTFGERARCKINVIPVVPRPIRKALFGAG